MRISDYIIIYVTLTNERVRRSRVDGYKSPVIQLIRFYYEYDDY